MNVLRFMVCACFFLSCDSRLKDTGSDSNKFARYYNEGEKLYLKNCSNCHQKNGGGLRRLYPPINKSDFVDNRLSDVLCIMRYGAATPLVVNGITFTQKMPPNDQLGDLEIAEIATYLYNTWGREQGLIEVSDVTAELNRCDTVK